MWTSVGNKLPRAVLVAVVLCAAATFACSDKAKPVAKLVEILSGTASKSQTRTGWLLAPPGSTFVNGDALRTDEHGIARLEFVGELLRMGPNTTVYFGKKSIDFDGEIEVGTGMTQLGLDFGEAEVTTTGRLILHKRDGQVRFQVSVGEATITRLGETTTFGVGDEYDLVIDTGTIERLDTTPDAGIPDASPPDAQPVPAVTLIAANVSGSVRVREPGGPWKKLRRGTHEFSTSMQFDVKRRAKVRLTRDGNEAVVLGPSTALITPALTELVELQRGQARVVSETSDAVISVPNGSIAVHPEPITGRASVTVARNKTTAKLEAGQATLRGADGSAQDLQLGELGAISNDGTLAVRNKTPKSSHLRLVGNADPVTIHTPSTPVDLRIQFAKHCKLGMVELARRGTFRNTAQERAGAGSAILRLGSGEHQYRIRCYEDGNLSQKVVAEGVVTVRKDTGARPLPKKAPRNTVETDGRRYLVLYQNRLPAITFRWPNAPKGSAYVVNVVPANKRARRQRKMVNVPKSSFPPGAFREGIYSFWFAKDDIVSKTSTLEIAFDNAAATGYISSPKPNSNVSGGNVRVAGAAVQGWTVSVHGKELALDRQRRFNANVPVSQDGTVAIQFSHPTHGTHLYLRR